MFICIDRYVIDMEDVHLIEAEDKAIQVTKKEGMRYKLDTSLSGQDAIQQINRQIMDWMALKARKA